MLRFDFPVVPRNCSLAIRLVGDLPQGVYVHQVALLDCAKALQSSGFMSVVDDRWKLTTVGVQSLQSCLRVDVPGRLLFDRRERCPLADMTLYELTLELGAQSWTWRPWRAPKQRRKRDLPIPDHYTVGDAKVWYSGIEVFRTYLLALLQAEALRGLQTSVQTRGV